MNFKSTESGRESDFFVSVLDRSWDEIDLLDQRIACLEAQLKEAKAKRERKLQELKEFYQ